MLIASGTAAAAWLITGRRFDRTLIISVFCFIFILIVSIAVFGLIYSSDYDGNTYHKMAIGLMKSGWNPIRESSETFVKSYFPIDIHVGSVFIDHYAKGPWIYGAVVYAFTGNVQSGKAYNLWALLCLFCFAFDYFQEKLGGIKAFIVSLVSIIILLYILCIYRI